MTESRLAGRYLVKCNNNPTEDDETEPSGGFSEIYYIFVPSRSFVDLISPRNEWMADHVIGSLYSAWRCLVKQNRLWNLIGSSFPEVNEISLRVLLWPTSASSGSDAGVFEANRSCSCIHVNIPLTLESWPWPDDESINQQIIRVQLWVEAQIEIKLKETQLF